MGFNADDYYDFHCGNDIRFVKIAIKSGIYHTITIEADVAITLDFSGGTRKVEDLYFNNCPKVTRIIWPKRADSIKRLCISNADNLKHLDLSKLENLHELSVVDCRSLEKITGLPDTLRELNLHHVNMSTLDLTQAKKLVRLNIITDCTHFDVTTANHDQLQLAFIITNKKQCQEHKTSLDFTNCLKLHTLYVNTGNNVLDVNVKECEGLTDAAIVCGKGSIIHKLSDCTNLEFIQADKNLTLDEPATAHLNAIKKHKMGLITKAHFSSRIDALKKFCSDFYEKTRKHDPSFHDRETIIQESGARKEGGRFCGVKIKLLSVPVQYHTDTVKESMMPVGGRAATYDKYSLSPTQEFPVIYLARDSGKNQTLPTLTRSYTANNITAWNKANGAAKYLQLFPQDFKNNAVLRVLNQIKHNESFDPKHAIIFHGDIYEFTSLLYTHDLQDVAGRMTLINKDVLPETPALDVPIILPDVILATSIKSQEMLMDANKTLAERQTKQSNAQLLSDAELRDVMNDFSSRLAEALGKERQPPGYDLIEGDASNPIPRKAPPSIDSHPIEAAAEHMTPNATASREQSHKDRRPLDSDFIEGDASNPIPKKSLTPIDSYPVEGAAQHLSPNATASQEQTGKNRQPPDFDLIEGSASKPAPEERPPFPDSYPIDAAAENNNPASRQQALIANAAKLANAVRDMARNIGEPIDQIEIKGGAEKNENPPPTMQLLLEAAAKLGKAVSDMVANADRPLDKKPIDEQHLIDEAADLVKTIRDILDINDQFGIDAKAAKTEISPANKQRLLEMASKLGKVLSDMLANPSRPYDDQYYVGAEAASPAASIDKLQQAARRVAEAIQNMTNAALEINTSDKASPLNAASENAKKLVITLSKPKTHDRHSLVEAAIELLNCIEALHDGLANPAVPIAPTREASKADNITRLYLIERLNVIQSNHLKHPHSQSGEMFSPAPASGYEKILTLLLNSLNNTSNIKLTPTVIKRSLEELNKDAGIAKQLAEIEALLRNYLTKTINTTTSPHTEKPDLKNE